MFVSIVQVLKTRIDRPHDLLFTCSVPSVKRMEAQRGHQRGVGISRSWQSSVFELGVALINSARYKWKSIWIGDSLQGDIKVYLMDENAPFNLTFLYHLNMYMLSLNYRLYNEIHTSKIGFERNCSYLVCGTNSANRCVIWIWFRCVLFSGTYRRINPCLTDSLQGIFFVLKLRSHMATSANNKVCIPSVW